MSCTFFPYPGAATNAELMSASRPEKDRRRRHRAKMAAQVLVRGGIGTPEAFEETCMSVDVSRDGLLFMTTRRGYSAGQKLKVTFPYSSPTPSLSVPREARVVRAA